MTPYEKERRALQMAVGLAALVPVTAGLWGVVGGLGGGGFADGHVRYLSGILLGMGLMFWAMVPAIEARRWPFRMLAALVAFGGLARMGASLADQTRDLATQFALVMELVVTPLLFIWRERIDARRPAPAPGTAVPVTVDPPGEEG